MAKKVTNTKVKEAIPEKIKQGVVADVEEKEETPVKLSSKKVSSQKSDEGDTGDYLLKYQYGRELPLGDPRSNPTGGKSLFMKNQLLSQEKVRVLIPVESGSDPSVPFSVNLNGYRLDLPRNEYVDVPEQIAEVIMNSHNQTTKALEQFRVGGNKAKEDALS